MRDKTRSRCIPDYGDVHNPAVRARYGYLEAVVSIVGNVLISLVKLLLGLFINSIALVADGIHSLSDVSTSGIVLFSFRVAQKQPDKEHPHGHGRAEYIATLIIAIILIVVGLGFIQQSLERLLTTETIIHSEYALLISAVVLLSALGKELMARYSNLLAKKIQSDVLKADSWHHRSDAISSIGVAIGIIGARYGFPYLDPIFAIVVAIIIMYVGVDLAIKASNFLMGQPPDAGLVSSIEHLGRSTPGVKGIHDISVHDYGTTKVVTLHAEVDEALVLEEAHAIADMLEEKILRTTQCSTIIHVEPKELHADSSVKKKIIERVLQRQKQVISFHKIQIIRRRSKDDVTMHLVIDRDMPVHQSHALSHQIERRIQEQYGPCDVHIHFEPCSIQDCPICAASCEKRNKTT